MLPIMIIDGHPCLHSHFLNKTFYICILSPKDVIQLRILCRKPVLATKVSEED